MAKVSSEQKAQSHPFDKFSLQVGSVWFEEGRNSNFFLTVIFSAIGYYRMGIHNQEVDLVYAEIIYVETR
jgi:hypothetical protein